MSLKSLVIASSAAFALTLALPPSSHAQPPSTTPAPSTQRPTYPTTTSPEDPNANPSAVGTTAAQPNPKARGNETKPVGTSGTKKLPGTASPLPSMFLASLALLGAAGFVRVIRRVEN